MEFSDILECTAAVANDDKTAPPVHGATSMAVMPLAVAEHTQHGKNTRRPKKKHNWSSNPFLDLRVLVILIGLALVVGLTVGLVMKSKIANESAVAALSTPNDGPDGIPSDGKNTKIPSPSPTTQTPPPAEPIAEPEPPLQENTEESPNKACQQVNSGNAPSTAIEFSMKLTTETPLNEMLNKEQFGELLVDSTFHHIFAIMQAFPYVTSMNLKVEYSGDCQLDHSTSCSTISAKFDGQVELTDGESSDPAVLMEPGEVQGIVRNALSDSGLVAWVVSMSEAGIDVTSVTVFQSCHEIGTYAEGSDGTLPEPIVPEPDWAEIVVRRSDKEGTIAFPLEEFVMKLARTSSTSIVGAETSIYVTFGHLYKDLLRLPTFASLRLRVENELRRKQLRGLRGLTSTTTTSVYTGRIRFRDDPSSPGMDEIRKVLDAALTGANLDAWLGSANAAGLDVSSVAVFDGAENMIGSSG